MGSLNWEDSFRILSRYCAFNLLQKGEEDREEGDCINSKFAKRKVGFLQIFIFSSPFDLSSLFLYKE